MDIKKISEKTEASAEAETGTRPRATDTLMRRIEAHGRLMRDQKLPGSTLAASSVVDRVSEISALGRAAEAATGASRMLEISRLAINPLYDFRPPSLFEDLERMRKAMDPFAGMSELARRQLMSPISFEVADVFRSDGAIAQMNRSLAEAAIRYTIPTFDHLSGIAERIAASVAPIKMPTAGIAEALAGFRTPWLDASREIASAAAALRVQSIGQLVARPTAFDGEVSSLLRTSLGDWRDSLTLPSNIVEYPVRTALYTERGFDPSLVEIPDRAFDENLDFAGLAFAPSDNLVEGPEDEDAQQRTSELHAVLQRFEIALRQFIDRVMTEAFGEDWPRRRLPNNMLDGWLHKRQQDPRGNDWRPIDYADFTDYERIITRGDNFRDAFAAHFARAELLRESMQRLAPSRIAAMHARPLGRDDVLLTTVEVRRLMLVIGQSEDE